MCDEYTLVSCIGTGVFEDTDKGRYRKTSYRFDEKSTITCYLFTDAIIEYYGKQIKKAIIIGTKHSAWKALLSEASDEECFELQTTLDEKGKHEGVCDSDLMLLEKKLNENSSLEYKLLLQPESLSSDTVEQVLSVYDKVYPNLWPSSRIIIDITHGFRYMPILLYQSLQYHSDRFGLDDIKIIYGEFIKEKSLSYVRDISSVWRMAEINKQIYAFRNSFDGARLSNTLRVYEAKGLADWIEGFSGMIQKNLVMQIHRAIRELRNTLKKYRREACNNTAGFISEVYSYLVEIEKAFDGIKDDKRSIYLYRFSKLLHEHGLQTQAIISLRFSYMELYNEKYEPELIGFDTSLEELRKKDSYNAYIDTCRYLGIIKEISELQQVRNCIAHAGAKLNDDSNSIDSKPLGSYRIDFDRLYKAVGRLFENEYKCSMEW